MSDPADPPSPADLLRQLERAREAVDASKAMLKELRRLPKVERPAGSRERPVADDRAMTDDDVPGDDIEGGGSTMSRPNDDVT